MRNNCKIFIANTKSHCSLPDVTETPNSLSNHFAKCAILCRNVVGISANSCELSNNLATSLAGGDWGIVTFFFIDSFQFSQYPSFRRLFFGTCLDWPCPFHVPASSAVRRTLENKCAVNSGKSSNLPSEHKGPRSVGQTQLTQTALVCNWPFVRSAARL